MHCMTPFFIQNKMTMETFLVLFQLEIKIVDSLKKTTKPLFASLLKQYGKKKQSIHRM